MTDYETPMMRDVNKLLTQVFLGLIIAVGIIALFVFPFNVTEYCNHGIVTTENSIVKTILSDLTGVCF